MTEHEKISNKIVNLVGAVDQGTSSTRFLVFDPDTAEIVTYHQMETKQLFPQAGWVEQDPMHILSCVSTCIDKTVEKLREFEIDPSNIKAVGITNQRETTVVWNKHTGQPLYNAIIWLDSRTAETVKVLKKKRGVQAVEEKSGLPINTYFSAVKLKWLIENIPEIQEAIKQGECLFGTVDSWIIWNLTGGVNNGIHVTDVTNASRTMLMDLKSLRWNNWLCNFFDIPTSILPTIRSSSEILGYMSHDSLHGVPISGCLGDQSAALLGQLCLEPGSAKNTYGTGCFLLCNTGKVPVFSKRGLLTTVAFKLGEDTPAIYALEGSVAIAGALVQWLRDKMGLISDSGNIETLARTVDDTHGVYFVPAFSGLYAPHWQPSARGTICGLTQYSNRGHIARAALEAVCFQVCEIADAMKLDSGYPMEQLQVDGGMTSNKLLLQIQADLLGIPVILPSMPETTALGAAMAAGAAKGIEVWNIATQPRDVTTDVFSCNITEVEKDTKYAMWKKAVERSLYWEEDRSESRVFSNPIIRSLPGGIFLFTSFAMLMIAEKLN